jgi:hypothetical protein
VGEVTDPIEAAPTDADCWKRLHDLLAYNLTDEPCPPSIVNDVADLVDTVGQLALSEGTLRAERERLITAIRTAVDHLDAARDEYDHPLRYRDAVDAANAVLGAVLEGVNDDN